MPGRDVADFFFGKDGFVRLSWDVIAHVIGSLIEHGEYLPYREEDAIDDYNILDGFRAQYLVAAFPVLSIGAGIDFKQADLPISMVIYCAFRCIRSAGKSLKSWGIWTGTIRLSWAILNSLGGPVGIRSGRGCR